MGVLIGWELKKLVKQKTFWVISALSVAIFLFISWDSIRIYGVSGYAKGYRDTYLAYEGQAVTDAFRAQVKQSFNQYVQAHADRFELNTDTEGGPDYWAIDWGYYTGVWQAYQDMEGLSTLEDEQELLRNVQQRVATGTDETGKPLSAYNLRYYQNRAHLGVQPQMVHDVRAWQQILNDFTLPGILSLICIGVALFSLFNGEATARMEALVMTARYRRQVFGAKLLAGMLVVLGIVAIFIGSGFAVSLGIWGTQGATLPIDTIYEHTSRSSMIVGVGYGLILLVLLTMACACGAVVAWASAQFRHPLGALLAAAAILVGMALIEEVGWAQNAYRWMDAPWFDTVNAAALLVPPIALIQTEMLPWRIHTMPWLLLEFVVPLAMMVVFFAFAQRAFLRRRKV